MAPVRLCACAALAAITLTACGGTAASPAAPTAASPTSVPPSTRADAPGEISSKALARVYRATVRAGSYRLAVRTSQPTAAGIVTGTLTGRSTTTTPRASVMSAVIRGATTLRLHVLQLGRDVYVRSPALRQVLPGAGSWGHLHSHGHTEPGTGIALPDIVYLTGAAGVVRILGTDTLRGTRTTHYRAEISFPKLLHNLPGEVRAAVGQRHHRQRHLLEQLQLRPGRALPHREHGDGHALPGRHRRPAVREPQHVDPNNRVYGNYLVGVGAVQQVLLKQKDAQTTGGNVVRDNVMGAGGADLNARDLFYDGNGQGNCWGPNTLASPTEPAAGAQFAACPFSGANAFDSNAQGTILGWAVDKQESHWIKHAHAAKPGYTPLERYVKGQTPMEQPATVIARRTTTLLAVAGLAALAAGPAQAGRPAAKRKPQKKTVKVYDNYYGPTKLTVNAGSIVTWKWTADALDEHDVKLTKGPKGAKKFWSDPGRRRLRLQAAAHEARDLPDPLHLPRGGQHAHDHRRAQVGRPGRGRP